MTIEYLMRDGNELHVEYSFKKGRDEHDWGLVYLEDVKIKAFGIDHTPLPLTEELERRATELIMDEVNNA